MSKIHVFYTIENETIENVITLDYTTEETLRSLLDKIKQITNSEVTFEVNRDNDILIKCLNNLDKDIGVLLKYFLNNLEKTKLFAIRKSDSLNLWSVFVICGIKYKLPNGDEYVLYAKNTPFAVRLRAQACIPKDDKYITEEVDSVEAIIERIKQLVDVLYDVSLPQKQKQLHALNNIIPLDIERVVSIADAGDVKRSSTGALLKEIHRGITAREGVVHKLARYFRAEAGTRDLTDLYIFELDNSVYALPLKDKVASTEEVEKFFKEKGLKIIFTNQYRLTHYKMDPVIEDGFVDISFFSFDYKPADINEDDAMMEFKKRFIK